MSSRKDPVKILLVDDLKANLLALESLLRSDGYEIYQAESGNQALDLLLVHDFAVALLDVQMPGMDGFELAEIMRSTSRTVEIPIIFVTAASWDERKIFKGYDAGAVDFLYKPLQNYVVRSKVEVFSELYRQKRLLRRQLQETERALEEADRAKEALKEAVETRDRFLSIASHELKTPLTSLKIQLQLTERFAKMPDNASVMTAGECKIERGLRISNQQVNRLTTLVDELLDVSRSAAGRLTLDVEEFALDELVNEIAERFSGQLSEAGCTLRMTLDAGVTGFWDRSRIDQVVTNLVSNALKYARGTPVEIRLFDSGETAVLMVRDHGPGIGKRDQLRLFDRFERGTNANSGIGGLGLGLYITRQIVNAHGGQIGVESEPGAGACFTVWLPRSALKRSSGTKSA